MTRENSDTSAKILKAAEDEFLEKGYGGARMLSIASRAGISHSMLHYYFTSKEELFNNVFNSKMDLIADILSGIYQEDKSLTDIIRTFSEKQFETIRSNAGFCLFVVRDVIRDEENLRRALAIMTERFSPYFEKFKAALDEEIKAGRIREISPANLIMNVVSLNISTFLATPVIRNLMPGVDIDQFLNERKESNIGFILSGLKPE